MDITDRPDPLRIGKLVMRLVREGYRPTVGRKRDGRYEIDFPPGVSPYDRRIDRHFLQEIESWITAETGTEQPPDVLR